MKKVVITVIALMFLGSATAGQTKVSDSQELKEVNEFLNNFLHTWLVEQDIDKAVGYFDNKKLDENTRKVFSVNNPSFDINIWTRKILTMWLSYDHGQMELYGHGEPNDPGYANLPLNPSDLISRVNWQDVTEAVRYPVYPPVAKIDNPDDAGNADLSSDSYLAMFLLNNSPRDALTFFIEKVNNEWKITFHAWIVA
jgi:hypothetical protein